MQELVLSEDPATGEITRLTRFLSGADTAAFGGKAHPFPEEIFIVAGRLFDGAFSLWLESGHCASRPPGEVHGPFRTDGARAAWCWMFPFPSGVGKGRHDAGVNRGLMNDGQCQSKASTWTLPHSQHSCGGA